jgi:ElaB/YqjD/DUF883 family membrane-anchored ribosome-binding protein
MNHTTTRDSFSGGTEAVSPVGAKVEGVAQAAHQTTDRIADKANAQVDRLKGTVHRTVDGAADTATSAAEWASAIPEQARQTRLTDSASASIRARPLTTVAGALAIGYLIGRLARL